MKYTITRPGMTTVSADSPEAAAKLVAALEAQDAALNKAAATKDAWNKAYIAEGGPGSVAAWVESEYGTPWTPATFQTFVDSLATVSKKLLATLVRQGEASDEELRSVTGTKSNQALAGILSAISKRSASVGIPVRAVFTVANSRVDGARRSSYTVSQKFRDVAADMNWVTLVELENSDQN